MTKEDLTNDKNTTGCCARNPDEPDPARICPFCKVDFIENDPGVWDCPECKTYSLFVGTADPDRIYLWDAMMIEFNEWQQAHLEDAAMWDFVLSEMEREIENGD